MLSALTTNPTKHEPPKLPSHNGKREGRASWRSWTFLTNFLSSSLFSSFSHFEIERGIGQRQRTSQSAFPSIAGRRANQSSSKSPTRHCGFHRGVARIRSLLDFETSSLDEVGFRLRLFYSFFPIHERGDTRKRILLVCVKTEATNISQKSLLAALLVSALSSLVSVKQS